MFAVIVANLVVIVGLWRMKNWARIGVIVLDPINLLRTAIQAMRGGYEGYSGAGLIAPILSVAPSVYVIYWSAKHRPLFD